MSGASPAYCAAPMVENPATECERSAVVLSTLSNGAVSAPVIGLGPKRNAPFEAPTDWPPADLKNTNSWPPAGHAGRAKSSRPPYRAIFRARSWIRGLRVPRLGLEAVTVGAGPDGNSVCGDKFEPQR